MSKRAPNADTVPVRRATRPSTASSTSATVASGTTAGVDPAANGRRSGRRPRTPVPAARASLGPPGRSARPVRARPASSVRRHATDAPASRRPTQRRPRARPTVAASAAMTSRTRERAIRPVSRLVNPSHRASVSRGTTVIRTRRTLGSAGVGGGCRLDEAQAFWLVEPGRGEIRPVALPEPGPGRRARPHPADRGQPRHRVARLPRRRARGPVRRDARAVPGGRLPRPGEVRLPQRRAWSRRGRPSCAGARCSVSTRIRRAYVVPADAVLRRADGVPRAPGRARRDRRDRASTRSGTPAPLVGDRITVVGAGMVGCCVARLLARDPRRRASTLVDVDPARARSRRRWASGSRCPTEDAAATGPGASTPAPPRPDCSVAGPARARGHRRSS